MRKLVMLLALFWAPLVHALSPYVQGDSLAPGDVQRLQQQVAGKLSAAGLKVVGRYTPSGLSDYGVVVATDADVLNAIRDIGGNSIVGAAVRVGVKSDGSVSYINPEYWYRAFFGKKFDRHQKAVKSLESRLKQALGDKGTFGGDVPQDTLAGYRYMFGLESFSDPTLLKSHASFDAAISAVRKNLSAGERQTRQVYEVVLPDKQLAVFGVAMNDRSTGDGAWVNKLIPDYIAALPYELFVVGKDVYTLHPRYRIAISWPALTMGTFLKIGNTPTEILGTLTPVAGGTSRAAAGRAFHDEWF